MKLREIIEILEAVYKKHCADKGRVKSAADRAEAKLRFAPLRKMEMTG